MPAGVCWCIVDGGYFAESTEHIPNSIRHNARLDTFTRCQETTDVYVSLVEEMVKELEICYGQLRMAITGDLDRFYVSHVLNRAKQIMGDKK